MRIFNNKNENLTEGAPYMKHEHKDHRKPIPPHERKAFMSVELDETDWELLQEVFGDSDTAKAAAEIIKDAPPEIQILAIQIINILEEVA